MHYSVMQTIQEVLRLRYSGGRTVVLGASGERQYLKEKYKMSDLQRKPVFSQHEQQEIISADLSVCTQYFSAT